jgi:MSHA pilin protein MshC
MSACSLQLKTRPKGRVFASKARQSGYSVVELVIVLVLMGILAANAMPRFFEASRFDEMGYADAVESALRYAQKLALASRCEVRVEVTSAGYALFRRQRQPSDPPAPACPSGGFTVAVNRPGGQTWTGAAPTGIGVGTLDIYFDAWGSPYDTASGAAQTATVTLAIGARSISLEPETGYAHSG